MGDPVGTLGQGGELEGIDLKRRQRLRVVLPATGLCKASQLRLRRRREGALRPVANVGCLGGFFYVIGLLAVLPFVLIVKLFVWIAGELRAQ